MRVFERFISGHLCCFKMFLWLFYLIFMHKKQHLDPLLGFDSTSPCMLHPMNIFITDVHK